MCLPVACHVGKVTSAKRLVGLFFYALSQMEVHPLCACLRAGHVGKVMSVDCSATDPQVAVSCGADRTIKASPVFGSRIRTSARI